MRDHRREPAVRRAEAAALGHNVAMPFEVDLSRFHEAQADPLDGYADALEQMRAGRKTTHWIWYVFPQLAGLGTSGMAGRYAISGRAEAEAYLRDPVLGPRLLEVSSLVESHLRKGQALSAIMGSDIDAKKLVSSMTLFEAVAQRMSEAGEEGLCEDVESVASNILAAVSRQGYARCRFTLSEIGATRRH